MNAFLVLAYFVIGLIYNLNVNAAVCRAPVQCQNPCNQGTNVMSLLGTWYQVAIGGFLSQSNHVKCAKLTFAGTSVTSFNVQAQAVIMVTAGTQTISIPITVLGSVSVSQQCDNTLSLSYPQAPQLSISFGVIYVDPAGRFVINYSCAYDPQTGENAESTILNIRAVTSIAQVESLISAANAALAQLSPFQHLQLVIQPLAGCFGLP